MEQSPFHPELTSLSTEWQVIISISTMFIFAVINCMPIRFQGVLNYIGTFIQLVSTLAVVLTLIITCPQQSSQQVGTSTTHNNSDNTNYMAKSASDIFFSTFNGTGLDDSYLFYVYLIGTLGSFYSFVGYEASGHLGEETKNPSRSVPRGIVYTCVASALTGLCYLLCLLVAVAGNVDGFLSSSDQPSVFQIFTQCTSPYGALSLSILLIVNVFFSGSKTSPRGGRG